MGFFRRKYDDTEYGSSERRDTFLRSNGAKEGVTVPSHMRYLNRQFDKREQKAKRRAERMNRGGLF